MYQSSSSSNIALDDEDLEDELLLLVVLEVGYVPLPLLVLLLLINTEAVLCPPCRLGDLLTFHLGQCWNYHYLQNSHQLTPVHLLTTTSDIQDKSHEALTME